MTATLAIKFFTSHSPRLLSLGIPLYNTTLHTLSALLLPTHIATSALAQRFRSEKFVIQMSRAGFALFVGWLTEGTGAEGMGIGEGIIEGGREGSGRRARMSVLTVVNGRLKFHGEYCPISNMSLTYPTFLKLLPRQR